MKKKNLKKESADSPKEVLHVHPELKGFEIEINSFGEIVSNFDIDTINAFLNKNVADKKLKDRNFDEVDNNDEDNSKS
jgi:hypothetical protein